MTADAMTGEGRDGDGPLARLVVARLRWALSSGPGQAADPPGEPGQPASEPGQAADPVSQPGQVNGGPGLADRAPR